MARYLYRRMNRELRKMKFRAAGSAVLIFVAVSMYIAFASMTPSAGKTLETTVQDLKLNHYLVHVGNGTESEVTTLSSIPGVQAVDYRLVISSRMIPPGGDLNDTFSATLVGIEPSRQPLVNLFQMREGYGNYFTGNGSGTALVEKAFAKRQEIEPGSTISVRVGTGYVDVTTVGLVFSPEHIFMPINPQSVMPLPGTLAVIYLPIDWLRASFGMEDSYLNEFTFYFDEGQNHEALRATIDRQLASNAILYSIPQEQVYGYALIREDIKQGESFSGVLAFLILLIAFFVVYSSFARIIQEQRREIGVLRALGYSRGSVLASYLYMAFMIGIVSSIIGLAFSVPFGQWFANYYVRETLDTTLLGFEVPTYTLVAGLLFGPVTACLASGIAVWGTVSMEPQNAIRGMHPRATKVKRVKEKKVKAGKGRGLSYMTLYTLRNMGRRKMRTGMTVMAVSFSIVLGGFPFVMMGAFSNSMTSSVTTYEHWDLVVDFAYPLNETTATTITSPHITDTVTISRIAAKWHADGKSGTALAIGLDRNQTLHTFKVSDGQMASQSWDVMLGYKFSLDNNIKPGSSLQLETLSGNRTATVTTVVDDMIGEMYLSIEAVSAMIGEPLYNGMYVKCTEGLEDQVRNELLNNPLVADSHVKENMKLGILSLMEDYYELLYIFALMAVSIAVITIANIVFVGVLERYYEYGQLRAVGYSRRDVSKSILTEISLVILIGSIVAVPITFLLLESMVDLMKSFWSMYESIIYPQDWIGYVFIVVLTFVLGFLAAIPGIRYVNRMDIAKSVSGGQFG